MRSRAELRAYQDRVAGHFYEHDVVMAILRMGAGKTASALTATEELIRDKVIRHGLILAPKRVATLVWPDEIRTWEHTAGLTFSVLDGTPLQRLRALTESLDRDLTICGIDNIQWLVEMLKPLPLGHPIFDLLIIDETSRFKSPKSKRAKALMGIIPRFKNRWGLTGTPRPNSSLDLFTPVKLITAGRLWGKSYYAWRQANFHPVDFQQYDWRPNFGTEARIQRDLATVAITLADSDMPDLPDLNIIVSKVVLPDAARAKYKRMERDLFATLDDGDHVVALNQAVATGKLAQIANGFLYADDKSVEAVHDEKTQWLADLVEDLNGEPIIVVYEFIADLQAIEKKWPGVPVIGHGHADAARTIEDWNAGRLPMLVLHAAAGGHGLNLQHGGSRMAWLSPCWSPELWDQTVARIHRPGQAAGKVTVHVCVADDTVDAVKRLRVIDKLSQQAALERWLKQRVAA